jgi:DNA-binding NarL/FixJ family response regulator
MMHTSILAVDDSEMFLRGLASILALEPEIELIGTAHEGEQAVEVAQLHTPDVIILDLRLSWNSSDERPSQAAGLRVLRQFAANVPDTAVIVMSSFAERRWVVQAMDAGACGFLPKEASVDELVAAIHTAARGGVVLTAEQLRWLREPLDPLTPREREVLALLAQGKSDGEIALALGVAVRTASKHVENIRQKVGASSRGEAVALALEKGLA